MRKEVQTISSSEEYICPKCQNIGWVIIPDGGQGTAIECDCGIRRKQIQENKLTFADIPDAFKEVRLKNFQKKVYKSKESQEMIVDIAKAVKYWLGNLEEMKNRGIGLYFYSGTKGSGKTRLAASIANELVIEKNIQVKFATSIKILEEIANTWKDNKSPEKKLINELLDTDILIIDDFGAENMKGWINDKFYSIINGRYVSNKITIFTSNMSLDDLPYDDRITNRIKEKVLQIPFPEESVRDHIAENLKIELMKGAGSSK